MRGNEYSTITCRGILDGTTQADRGITHIFAKLWITGEEWTRCLLDHFLMSALNTAFALAHVNHVANSVSKDLVQNISGVALVSNVVLCCTCISMCRAEG